MDKNVNIGVRGQNLKGVIENPDSKKLMILVHGFTGDWRGPDNIFVKLSNRLQDEGYAVLRFSFIGTPPSEENFQNMTLATETQDLEAVLQYAKSLGYTEIGILGESMGAGIVANSYTSDLKVVVLWYPSLNYSRDAFTDYLKESNQKELKEKGYVLTDGFKVGAEFISQIPHINLEDKIQQVTSPILFLHGDSDTDVPVEISKDAFKRANEPKEIHIIQGAEHCFKNEQNEVIDLTVDFLKRYF